MGLRDDAVRVVKSSFVSLSVKAASTWLCTQVPFLANPYIKNVMDKILDQMFNDIYDKGEIAAFFFYIDLRVDKQGRHFHDAALKYHSAKPEDKHLYEKEYIEAFYNFASLRS